MISQGQNWTSQRQAEALLVIIGLLEADSILFFTSTITTIIRSSLLQIQTLIISQVQGIIEPALKNEAHEVLNQTRFRVYGLGFCVGLQL